MLDASAFKTVTTHAVNSAATYFVFLIYGVYTLQVAVQHT